MDLPKFMEQKEKIRKAQALYEPWMDNKATLEESKDYIAPPPQHPPAKHRSQFTFDSEYLKMDSKTPTSSTVSAQSRVAASRNSAVSIYLPTPNTPEEPTPLPFDERPFYAARQQQKPRETSIIGASRKEDGQGRSHTAADVVSFANAARVTNSQRIPLHRQCSSTSTKLPKLLIETDYIEFYAWVLNGKEADLSTSEIVRLLFGKSGTVRRKPTPESAE